MSVVLPPTTWRLVSRHELRPDAPQVTFRLPAGSRLISRDFQGDDGRLLAELIIPHRLPELTGADYLRDVPLHRLLDEVPRLHWGAYGLTDPLDDVYVLHRYPGDRREDIPRRTSVGLQVFHDPRRTAP